jgi:ribosome biogenesis GTPase A
MEPYWDLVKRIIKESDLVLEVLDARLVELSRNEEVERLIREIGRPVIFVINKTDLVSREYLQKQVEELKKIGDVAFISTKQRGSTKILLYKIKKTFQKYGKREETVKKFGAPKTKLREAKANIVVGVLGYPNVGKSSIINRLSFKKKTKVGKKAGTTHGIHWITASKDIKLIDSPGVIPLSKDDEIRYGLIGARDSSMLRNPEIVADALIKLFLIKHKKAFTEYYKLELEDIDKADEGYTEEIIIKIGKKRNFLLKGGKIDENRASIMIVRDWQEGRLRL